MYRPPPSAKADGSRPIDVLWVKAMREIEIKEKVKTKEETRVRSAAARPRIVGVGCGGVRRGVK